MYIYVYICIYIYVYICICIYIYTNELIDFKCCCIHNDRINYT